MSYSFNLRPNNTSLKGITFIPMLCVHYKGYSLAIMLPSDEECRAVCFSVVKISKDEDSKPMAILYDARPIRTEQESITRGFELGANWIDETLPQLTGSYHPWRWTTVRNNVHHSTEVVAKLHAVIATSHSIIDRSKNLLSRSHKIDRTVFDRRL